TTHDDTQRDRQIHHLTDAHHRSFASPFGITNLDTIDDEYGPNVHHRSGATLFLDLGDGLAALIELHHLGLFVRSVHPGSRTFGPYSGWCHCRVGPIRTSICGGVSGAAPASPSHGRVRRKNPPHL